MAYEFFGAEDPDVTSGKNYLRYFYDVALKFDGFPYKTFEEFLNAYGPTKSQIWWKNVGSIARVGEMTPEEVADVLEGLAENNQGKLPRLPTDFGEALATKAKETSFFDILTEATTESAKDIAKGIVTAGEAVTDTMSNVLSVAKYAVPAILVGGAILWVIINVKRASLPK